jgi:hypothetical protein
MNDMDTGQIPGTRAALRRATKARAIRDSRIKLASIVAGAVVAVLSVWAVFGAPGLSLVTGGSGDGPEGGAAAASPSGTSTGATSVTGTPTVTPSGAATSATRDPALAKLDQKLSTSQPGASGFKQTAPKVGLGPNGFAPICGGPAASDKLVLSAVTSTLTGTRAGAAVTILASQAVYKSGGVNALLAEAKKSGCVEVGDPLPNYPKGSVLLRGQGSTSEAYLVTPTSASTALYLKTSSKAEDAVVDTLFGVVPGLVADAQAKADDLIASIPN